MARQIDRRGQQVFGLGLAQQRVEDQMVEVQKRVARHENRQILVIGFLV